MTGISLQRDLGLALLPTGPALAHEKPLADPAVNIQTDFNTFNIYVPVHQIRFALRAARSGVPGLCICSGRVD